MDTSGSITLSPNVTTNYSVTCTGPGGSATANSSITVFTTPPPSSLKLPGPNAEMFANNPYYTCVTHRYVATAANGGSDSNDGTSPTNLGNGVGPWLTLTKANSALPSPAPGWCVNIGDGTYNVNSISLNKGGNLASMTGFTVYRAMNLLGAKLVATSNASGLIQIRAPYIIIDGLELHGKRYASVNHGIDSCFNGMSYNGLHHISVFNTYVHDVGGNGIGTCWAEYFWMIHNRLEGNAYNSWNSGISTYQPIVIPNYTATSYDQRWTPYHNVYAYNRFNNNFTLPAGGPHTDGNGLIYDDSQHAQSSPQVVYAHKL